MATTGDDTDECAICLQPYDDPRFLPCHHSYCAKCIQKLFDSTDRRTIPCPSCRKPATLPDGGARKLTRNFYITASRRRASLPCLIHEDVEVKFHCIPCDAAICPDCRLKEHEGHEIQDLAVRGKKTELEAHHRTISIHIKAIIDKLDTIRKQILHVQRKRSEAEKSIHQQHSTLLSLAHKAREEALASLDTSSKTISDDLDKNLSLGEENLEELLNLQRQIEATLEQGSSLAIVNMAKELISGPGSKEAVRRRSREVSLPINDYPVWKHTTTESEISDAAYNFIGDVSTRQICTTEMEIRERFNCGDEANARVFSLCHVDFEPPTVLVSFESLVQGREFPVKMFRESGQFSKNDSKTGRVSYKRYAPGWSMVTPPLTGGLRTYSKSLKTDHYRLDNDFTGSAKVVKVTVISNTPLKTAVQHQFSINIGAHRAIDVDEGGQAFVIVEEAQENEMWRKVLMYTRGNENSVCKYSPPNSPFQPSDVAFYKLSGQQVSSTFIILLNPSSKGGSIGFVVLFN